MSEPVQIVPTAAEKDAEAAEVYAPPREDAPPAQPPVAARPEHSPALIGFLTLLPTSAVSSLVAGGMMSLWYSLTPIRPGFLAGLEETILAVFGWLALSAFAVLGGIALAAGILGRERKVSNTGRVLTALLGIAAAAVCFIPAPESTFFVRGALGLFSEVVTLALTHASLVYAARRFLPRPEE